MMSAGVIPFDVIFSISSRENHPTSVTPSPTAGSPLMVTLDGTPIVAAASEAMLDTLGSGWFYRATDGALIVRFPGSGTLSTLLMQWQ